MSEAAITHFPLKRTDCSQLRPHESRMEVPKFHQTSLGLRDDALMQVKARRLCWLLEFGQIQHWRSVMRVKDTMQQGCFLGRSGYACYGHCETYA